MTINSAATASSWLYLTIIVGSFDAQNATGTDAFTVLGRLRPDPGLQDPYTSSAPFPWTMVG